ncbi:hypothetical protein DERF_014389 [Dermatophagoides farinae]|uniref:Uncharacterized protein n=1 Tax=Dermatophagoides farinae TaxID=6954 RepID=A0A922HM58_DERFA|nr:hypothetical protein DERF_014389 [Dermatophagoides farinae]
MLNGHGCNIANNNRQYECKKMMDIGVNWRGFEKYWEKKGGTTVIIRLKIEIKKEERFIANTST